MRQGEWIWWATGVAALTAVAAVAAILLVVRRRREAAPPTRAGRPAVREVWWAEVPFEDGPGAKDRPCLVVAVDRRHATVMKITSRDHTGRPGVVALPRGTVGDRQGKASWLQTGELRSVPLQDFRRRVGTLDARTWAAVRGPGRTGS
ncbi:type II toxin-antitoxin system PemK/MazF family toxin [Kitasatospora camelliae]|uniref:Type II toxin-antitoxin system PemK/MazF family toxin n=1 Tax=Kitasatospora camelliae TaxID=3156397 RepID=A0AAU8JV94_9ACTN